jgi:hypothetical protein
MPIKWPSKYNKSTNRHKEWETLKKTHAAAIKASKVNFGSDLGSAIDKFEAEIKKVANTGFAKTATLNDLEKVSQAGSKAQDIAKSYKGKIGKMAEPAKGALTEFLNDVDADGQVWQDNTLFEPEPVGKWKTAEWSACPALAGHLEVLVRHLGLAIKLLEKEPNFKTADFLQKLKPHAVALQTAATTARRNAEVLEKLYMNALGNNSYVGVLKGDTDRAIKGPFAALLKSIGTFEGYCKAEQFAGMYVSNGKNVDFRASTKVFQMIRSDILNVTKAEKMTVVT